MAILTQLNKYIASNALLKLISFYILISFALTNTADNRSSLSYQDQPDTGLANIQALVGTSLMKKGEAPTKIYGYVKYDLFYDTRQVLGSGQDQALAVPEPFWPDRFGHDINDRAQFHMSAVQSRFGLLRENFYPLKNISSSVRIEADFRGIGDINLFTCRLRLAYGEIKYDDNISILFGQFLNPLFILDCYPHTLGYSAGNPAEIGESGPQLRITKKIGNITTVLTALSQSYYTSDGPIGPSVTYIKNSLTPELNLTVKVPFSNHIFGFVIDFKRLVPRLVTDKCIKTKNAINSVITEAFLTFNFTNLFIRSKFIYAQNGNDQSAIGGYGVLTQDPKTDMRTYENISSMSGWLDMSYIRHIPEPMEIGFFIGYTQRLTNYKDFWIPPDKHEPIVYTGILGNIDSVFRMAPRAIWAYDPIRFGFEIWVDRAVYGCLDRQANLINLKPVTDVRFSAAIFYLF